MGKLSLLRHKIRAFAYLLAQLRTLFRPKDFLQNPSDWMQHSLSKKIIFINCYVLKHSKLSDIEFVHSLYRNILGRYGDEDGVNHHLKRLRQKLVSRRDLIEVFFNSEEFRLKHGETSVIDQFTLSNPLTVEERERLYFDTILTQDFYGEEYADHSWRTLDTTHLTKVDYLTKYFRPQRILDVGCSYGRLVKELRKRGIQAWGIDYSEAFIKNAEQDVRSYLSIAKIEELPNPSSEAYDLVICMELLEHLPLSTIERAIENLKGICRGEILLTVPSHGPNTQGRYGFPMHHVENWVSCSRKNCTFQVIPLHESTGIPAYGHVTLASYPWWTHKFLQHGLVRDYPLEEAIVYDEATKVYQFGWCLYVLREANESRITVGDPSEKQLGRGFTCCDVASGEKVAWTGNVAELFLKPKGDSQGILTLSLWGGPPELVFPRNFSVFIYQLNEEIDHIEKIALKQITDDIYPGEKKEIQIDLRPSPFNRKMLLCCEMEIKNTWVPEKLFNSFVWGDKEKEQRERGIGFFRADLV